ncbi:MAG: GNAT family N-acetyltransferase [Symbiobacteriaceae bacterium]|nr:GNAT family N-acetyltransferase [Symbiobacteriaceae bacterium]
MPYFKKIIGERLYLSPFCPDEPETCSKWAEWMNDLSVSATFGGHHLLVSISQVKKTLAELQGYRFDIVLQDGDNLIGHISLHDLDHIHRHAFLGVLIGETEHRNKGYAAEAIRLLLEYGFCFLNLHNIMLSVHADNKPGLACFRKVGFREAGRRREWVFKNGEYVDVIYMDMLAREFIKNNNESNHNA